MAYGYGFRDITRTYRSLVEDPVAAFRRIGYGNDLRFERVFLARVATVTRADILHHILVANADNYRKTPIHQALLRPIVGNGLLTSEGRHWRRQRRIAAPAFRHARLAGFAGTMTSLTREMLAGWTAGRRIEVHSEMARVTMRIIARAMFSDHLDDDEISGVSEAIAEIGRLNRLRFRDLVGVPQWVPRLPDRGLQRALRTVDGTIGRLIAERRAEGSDRADLLDMLMRARDEETGERMDDGQLRDEVITMFIAGHETTATALTWTFYALDRHREAERRLHAELDAAPPVDGSGDLERLPYTRMIIEETMRLYPTVPLLSRQAVRADAFDGLRIPKGGILNLNIWLAHRAPSVWEEPERFDPERFLPEQVEKRPRLAYLPFGAGPRICIGAGFAMLEMRLILAAIAREWRLRAPRDYRAHAVGSVVLRPRDGLPMTLERRREAASG